MPRPFAARSIRCRSAASNRILTTALPSSRSAIGCAEAPAPEMNAAAFASQLAGFTAWAILIVIVHLLCVQRIHNGHQLVDRAGVFGQP